jgi:hypothetical protein
MQRNGMDGQRFDELSRWFARGASRRSVLKGLFGGAAMAAGIARSHLQSGDAFATSPCPATESVQRNKVNGSCDAVKAHIQSAGVWSRLGGQHPGSSGWTDSKFETIPQIRFDLVPETDSSGNVTCYRPANLKPVYKVTSKVFAIDWQPTEQLSTCCEQERQRWTQAVYTHECHHVADDHGVVERRNAGMANFVATDNAFQICGVRESSARNTLKALISTEVNQSFQAVLDESDQLLADFHNSPEGAAPNLDCRKCQTCQSAAVGAASVPDASPLSQDMCCAFGLPCGNGCDAVCCAEGESCVDGQCQCPEICRADECCSDGGPCCRDSGGTAVGCCPANYNCGTDLTCCCDARQGPFDVCCPAGGCCISTSHPVCCSGNPNFCCPTGTVCCGQGLCCPASAAEARSESESEATPSVESVPGILASGSS